MLKSMFDVIRFYENRKSSWKNDLGPIINQRNYEYDFFVDGMKLPRSYIDFINRFDIEGVAIGSLVLTPYPNLTLAENLVKLNILEKNPLIPKDMLHVADFEGDLILMGRMETSQHGDNVYYKDISTGYFPPIEKLVDNFENFIVISANIHRINIGLSEKNDSDISNIIRDNFQNISENEIKTWEKISMI